MLAVARSPLVGPPIPFYHDHEPTCFTFQLGGAPPREHNEAHVQAWLGANGAHAVLSVVEFVSFSFCEGGFLLMGLVS